VKLPGESHEEDRGGKSFPPQKQTPHVAEKDNQGDSKRGLGGEDTMRGGGGRWHGVLEGANRNN